MSETPSSLEYKDFSLALHEKSSDEKRFVKAQIELTYACNLHCVHCYTDPYNQPEFLRREMPTEAAMRAIDKFHSEGLLWLCFTGGEIFMRKDFLALYDYAYEKGFLLTLFTNGTLITDKVADHLAEKPPFSIEVSIYGATAETFDRVTQVAGSYERCLQGIRRLLARNLPVKIKTSLMTLNRHELEAMKSLVESFGLAFKCSAIIYPRLNGDISSVAYRLDPKDIVKLEFSSDLEKESCVEVSAESDYRAYRCGCGKLNVHMDPYGGVGACTWQRKDRFDYKGRSIQSGMNQLADKLHAQVYPENSACHSCVAAYYCQKAFEMAGYENGGFSQQPVDHFCQIAFQRLEKNT